MERTLTEQEKATILANRGDMLEHLNELEGDMEYILSGKVENGCCLVEKDVAETMILRIRECLKCLVETDEGSRHW